MVDTSSARLAVRQAADTVLYASGRADDDRLLLDEVVEALRTLRSLRNDLGPIEAQFMEQAKDLGLTWEQIAELAYEGQYRQWMLRRYRTLGGGRKWQPGPHSLKLRAEALASAPDDCPGG